MKKESVIKNKIGVLAVSAVLVFSVIPANAAEKLPATEQASAIVQTHDAKKHRKHRKPKKSRKHKKERKPKKHKKYRGRLHLACFQPGKI